MSSERSSEASASFNPATAVPEIPGTGGGLATEQIARPPRVVFRLRLNCECGLRLVGCEYWFFVDTMHVRGVCLDCGVQELIFAPPNVNREGGEQQRARLVTADMIDAIHDIYTLRGAKAGTAIAT